MSKHKKGKPKGKAPPVNGVHRPALPAKQTEPEWMRSLKPWFLSRKDTELLLDALQGDAGALSQAARCLLPELRNLLRQFSDMAEQVKELETRLRANSFWDQGGHTAEREKKINKMLDRKRGERRRTHCKIMNEIAAEPAEKILRDLEELRREMGEDGQ